MASEKNITVRQFNGVDYDTLYPKTKVEQVEGAYTQQQILADSTKALFGLSNDAVPDDVFSLLGDYIPYPYGLLIVRVSNSNGDGVPAKINVSPSAGEVSAFHIMDNGRYSILVEPGTYTLTPATDYPFATVTTQAQTVTVKQSEPIVVNFSATKKESGEFDFTKSTEIKVPDFVKSVDLFGVGGGASGNVSLASGTPSNVAGGGAGYTTTLLSQNLSGKLLKITIGAGGAPITVTENTSSAGIRNGGSTKITVDGLEILVANGGSLSNGGSGGGLAYYIPPVGGIGTNYQGNGGSDGSDGEHGGTGQGTTTRKFGEETNTLYAGGGAGAHRYSSTIQNAGVGGAGGGGDGKAFYISTAGTFTGNSGTFYGGGGGAVSAKRSSDDLAVTIISGAGYQGLASIRW